MTETGKILGIKLLQAARQVTQMYCEHEDDKDPFSYGPDLEHSVEELCEVIAEIDNYLKFQEAKAEANRRYGGAMKKLAEMDSQDTACGGS